MITATKPWYEVFDKLAQLLVDFYQKNKDAGTVLYTLLKKTENKFKDEERLFKWLDKFEKVESIDPFHVFVTINAAGSNESRRIERINTFIDLLCKILL